MQAYKPVRAAPKVTDQAQKHSECITKSGDLNISQTTESPPLTISRLHSSQFYTSLRLQICPKIATCRIQPALIWRSAGIRFSIQHQILVWSFPLTARWENVFRIWNFTSTYMAKRSSNMDLDQQYGVFSSNIQLIFSWLIIFAISFIFHFFKFVKDGKRGMQWRSKR